MNEAIISIINIQNMILHRKWSPCQGSVGADYGGWQTLCCWLLSNPCLSRTKHTHTHFPLLRPIAYLLCMHDSIDVNRRWLWSTTLTVCVCVCVCLLHQVIFNMQHIMKGGGGAGGVVAVMNGGPWGLMHPSVEEKESVSRDGENSISVI